MNVSNTTPSPILTLHRISKRYGGVTALENVDFDLRAGEVHGLVGENGAGKSTMMKLLAGVYSDYEGEMHLHGAPVRFSSPADAQAQGIGMVFQELSTFQHLSVAENLFGRLLPARRGLVDRKRMNHEAQMHLQQLGLEIDVTTMMGHLPVGTQQIVEIARVIFSGAQIIILDEPTSALSPPEIRRLFDFIASLKTQGKSLIFISHFLEDVLEISDRITVLKDAHQVAVLEAKDSSKHQLVELMIGADASILQQSYEEESQIAEEHAVGDVVLAVEQLTQQGNFRDVSFELHAGEIVGLFGFMGAGQIQLARCLFGAEQFDEGVMRLNGRSLNFHNTTQAKTAGIAYVPENRHDSLMLQQEIYKNITLAHLPRLLGRLLNQKAEVDIASTQIKNLHIHPPRPTLPVGALSGGNQQKVVLAKWLTQTPKLLILNEPTRGIDVGAKDEVMTIVNSLRDQGVATLLISAEPETILSIADRALVMRKGRLTAELTGSRLTKENLMTYA
ncbi:MAG: sugar ABC transporter ATP-binding protein [Anaerolineaceae bacterium]|nr:sugar ABC transporter ATP-binding protein [Anaerolineaceae bacterium]